MKRNGLERASCIPSKCAWADKTFPSLLGQGKRCSGAAPTQQINNALGTLVRCHPSSDVITSPQVAGYNVNYVTVIEVFGGFISSAFGNKYLAPPCIYGESGIALSHANGLFG